MDWIAGAGSALGGISGIANFALGLMNYNYQKKLQKEMFEREDTSIARRVADLMASGLSPVLAAGQGAAAGPVVPVKPPEVSGIDQMAQIYMNLITQQANVAHTKADMDRISKQMEFMNSNIALNQYRKNHLKAQTDKTNIETIGQTIRNAQDALTYKLMEKSGIGKDAGYIGKGVRDLQGAVDKLIEKFDTKKTHSSGGHSF